jgi:hypothetical protein
MKTIQVILERQIIGEYATKLTLSKQQFDKLLKGSTLMNFRISFEGHHFYYYNEQDCIHIHMDYLKLTKPEIRITPGTIFSSEV